MVVETGIEARKVNYRRKKQVMEKSSQKRCGWKGGTTTSQPGIAVLQAKFFARQGTICATRVTQR